MLSKLKKQDYIIGIVLIFVGISMYINALDIRAVSAGLTVVIGSDFLPKITATLLTLFGVLFILIEWLRNRKKEMSETQNTSVQGRTITVLYSVLLLFSYAFLMPYLGFMITTALYLFLQIKTLAPKEKVNYLLFGIISVVCAVLIYVTFVNVFYLMLPRGLIF